MPIPCERFPLQMYSIGYTMDICPATWVIRDHNSDRNRPFLLLPYRLQDGKLLGDENGFLCFVFVFSPKGKDKKNDRISSRFSFQWLVSFLISSMAPAHSHAFVSALFSIMAGLQVKLDALFRRE